MGLSIATALESKPLEDPLAHLPCSTILEYRKGQTIYSHDQPSTSIYLVIDGKVKVCRHADDGRQVVVDIYQPDEFFGESAFLGPAQRTELSMALENTKLMTWTTSEIEDIATRRPRLAIALLAASRSAIYGFRDADREFLGRQHRPPARPRSHSFLGAAWPGGGERLGADDSVHARAPFAIRRNVPRDRHALHESISPAGLFDLFAKRHPAPAGRSQRLVAPGADGSQLVKYTAPFGHRSAAPEPWPKGAVFRKPVTPISAQTY